MSFWLQVSAWMVCCIALVLIVVESLLACCGCLIRHSKKTTISVSAQNDFNDSRSSKYWPQMYYSFCVFIGLLSHPRYLLCDHLTISLHYNKPCTYISYDKCTVLMASTLQLYACTVLVFKRWSRPLVSPNQTPCSECVSWSVDSFYDNINTRATTSSAVLSQPNNWWW